ncbi:hypothetical protein RGU75_05560 [Glaciimonas sp. CA11.2]|nr:hypothetical protein [Glaciimonas sp. CA11.2]MDY7545699.1 hypothetical protein [Glaciimonas sp. CA11.2]
MTVVTASHVKHVRSVVQRGMQPDGHMIGDPIVNSWIRCLNEYSLDPDNCDEPVVIGNVELQERQARLADVQQVAKIEMANLYQQLAGSGYAIMLMDCDGVLLNYFGDPSFTHAASKTGLMQGAVWSERLQGTNGMGTCLVEKNPLSCIKTNTIWCGTSVSVAPLRLFVIIKAMCWRYWMLRANRDWRNNTRWRWSTCPCR